MEEGRRKRRVEDGDVPYLRRRRPSRLATVQAGGVLSKASKTRWWSAKYSRNYNSGWSEKSTAKYKLRRAAGPNSRMV